MSLNAAAIRCLVEKGLSAQDLVDVAAALEADGKPRSAGAKRQARYRQKQAEGVTSNVTCDVTPPLKDNSKPLSSVSNETGVPPADPLKELFDVGVAVLMASGLDQKQARSLIGKHRKAKSDAEVLTALLECRTKAIANPIEWLEKRLKSAKWVSASGYEYRGSDEQVAREAERRNDMQTYWAVKAAMKRAA